MNKWTRESLTLEAKKYESRGEMAEKASGALDACYRRFPGLLDELFPSLVRHWDRDTLVQEAKRFDTRSDFIEGSRSAYFTALVRFPGLLDEIFEPARWTLESVLDDLPNYKSISEYQIKSPGAYQWVRRNCPSMIQVLLPKSKLSNTRDIVYVWRAEKGQAIYKVGVTSQTLGLTRLRKVMRDGGFTDSEIVIMIRVKRHIAKIVENLLKTLGEKVRFDRKFDGYTEFRKWTDDDMNSLTGFLSIIGEVQ